YDFDQINKTSVNILDSRFTLPMSLGRQIHDDLGIVERVCMKDEHPARLNFTLFAGKFIGVKILWKSLPELQRNAFAHYPYGIDSIHQGVNIGVQEITLFKLNHQ